MAASGKSSAWSSGIVIENRKSELRISNGNDGNISLHNIFLVNDTNIIMLFSTQRAKLKLYHQWGGSLTPNPQSPSLLDINGA